MGIEYHSAGLEAKCGIGMCGGVVEEADAVGHGESCGLCLFRANVVECQEHGVVNGSGIKEEDSDNLLDEADVSFGQSGFCGW